MGLKATNTFVWIIRDKTESEKSGLLIPGTGREKPHTGKIFSVGKKVSDPDIKSGKGKTAIFHRGIGHEIDYKQTIYLVLNEAEIIGVDD